MLIRLNLSFLLLVIAVTASGCGGPATLASDAAVATNQGTVTAAAEQIYVGEALVGEGNEVAHVDLMIGSKLGPVGNAFANAIANQTPGHASVLVVLEPNTAIKPSTVVVPKVTISGAKQAVQLFGPAQLAVAKAVTESVRNGTIPKARCEEWVIVCGIFIHFSAEDNKKIYDYNYEATKLAIKRALAREPNVNEVLKLDSKITDTEFKN